MPYLMTTGVGINIGSLIPTIKEVVSRIWIHDLQVKRQQPYCYAKAHPPWQCSLLSIKYFWISFIFKHDSTKFSFETLWRKIIKEKIQEPWIKKCTTTYQALRWFFLVASTLSVSQEPNEEWYYSYRDNIKEKLQKNWHFKLKMVSHTWTTWASPPKIWKGIIASCGL